MQVNNIGCVIQLINPRCGDSTEECELVGICCKRPIGLVTAIDLAGSVRREVRVLEHDIAYLRLAARNLKGIDRLNNAAKADLDGANFSRTWQ